MNSVSSVTISHPSDWFIMLTIPVFAFCVAGYVCERKDLLVNGCCNVNAPSSRQYICKSCLANGCCSIYEYCVSCCLQPDKVICLLKKVSFFMSCLLHSCCKSSKILSPLSPNVFNQFLQEQNESDEQTIICNFSYLCALFQQPLLERFLNRAAEGFRNLFTAVEDHFELCLAKCRTSSQVGSWDLENARGQTVVNQFRSPASV